MKILVVAAATLIATQPSTPRVTVTPSTVPSLTAPLPSHLALPADASPKFDLRPDFQGFMQVIPPPGITNNLRLVPHGRTMPSIDDQRNSGSASEPFRVMPVETDAGALGYRR
jgi:hypothetical protein